MPFQFHIKIKGPCKAIIAKIINLLEGTQPKCLFLPKLQLREYDSHLIGLYASIGNTVTLEVCSEETIYEIMMRYYPHNNHLWSYSWRYLGKPLNLSKTLDDNGIPDERDRFSDVALPDNIHIPAILLYYNDDLTEGKFSVCISLCHRFR